MSLYELDTISATRLLGQVRHFNDRWKAYQADADAALNEAKPVRLAMAELMRQQKDNCQLMLLKFASPAVVWLKRDVEAEDPNLYLVGVYGEHGLAACHIPFTTLNAKLSTELKIQWNLI